MDSRSNTLAALGSLAILVAVLVLASPKPGRGQSVPQVKVVNPASSPVQSVLVTPMKIDTTTNFVRATQNGAWSVGVTGTPTVRIDSAINTVKSAQSGTWTVGVTGAPIVKLDGTTNVVKAQQNGAWNVGITGTPAVTMGAGSKVGIDPAANTVRLDGSSSVTLASGAVVQSQQNGAWNVGISPAANRVVVANGAADPVLVRNVHDAVQPFQSLLNMDFPSGTNTRTLTAFVVPDGKRLVLEYVSANASIPTGQLAQVRVSTSLGGMPVSHKLVMFRQLVTSGNDQFSAAQSLRLYADPGTPVQAQCARNSAAGTASAQFTFSGYLVDLP